MSLIQYMRVGMSVYEAVLACTYISNCNEEVTYFISASINPASQYDKIPNCTSYTSICDVSAIILNIQCMYLSAQNIFSLQQYENFIVQYVTDTKTIQYKVDNVPLLRGCRVNTENGVLSIKKINSKT